MTKIVSPETGLCEKSPELVTLESFEKVFADWLALPAYLDTVEVDEQDFPAALGKQYNDAVEAARDRIYDLPGMTEKQKERADLQLLNNIFLSSDGAEGRFVALGFKPVCLVGDGYAKKSTMQEEFGSISAKMLDASSVYTEAAATYPQIGSTKGMFRLEHGSNHYSVYLYNRQAVAKVVQNNSGILTKLGYDVSKSADEIVEEVFGTGTDPVAESILKGYSPASAISFYLEHYPGDLDSKIGTWGAAAAKHTGNIRAREDGYWQSLETLLTPEQLAMARRVAGQGQGLRVIDTMTGNKDYIYARPRNLHVQKAWHISGMTDYLMSLRKQLVSHDLSDHERSFM